MVERYNCPPMSDQKPEPDGCMVYASDYDALAAELQRFKDYIFEAATDDVKRLVAAEARVRELEAQCEGMGKSCIANAGWILQLETALRGLRDFCEEAGFPCDRANMLLSSGTAPSVEKALDKPRPDTFLCSAPSDTAEPP